MPLKISEVLMIDDDTAFGGDALNKCVAFVCLDKNVVHSRYHVLLELYNESLEEAKEVSGNL